MASSSFFLSSLPIIVRNGTCAELCCSVYSRFTGGSYLGGVKLVRGYTEQGKLKSSQPGDKTPRTPNSAALKPGDLPPLLKLDEKQQRILKRQSAPPAISQPTTKVTANQSKESAPTRPRDSMDEELDVESVRNQDENEIRNDYHDRDSENQGRKIEHLLLVTHGIGQKLGMRQVAQQVCTYLSCLIY